MTDNKIKYNNCSKCENTFDSSTRIKGSNNNELCSRCGRDICFICGKKEQEKSRWEEGEDCCGNKTMIEVVSGVYCQPEKAENDPDRQLQVYYCDEHKEEAKKSPYLWTHADSERMESRKKQREREMAEKLNSQKGLFYCQDDYAHFVEGKPRERTIKDTKYGCFNFWGRENGKSFYLLVPDTHPVLNNFKYQKKIKRDGAEVELTAHNLKEKFFLIEGIEKLPLEATHDSGYSGNDPLVQAQHFSKVVSLDDKITIIPIENDSQPENQNEKSECDTCQKKLGHKYGGSDNFYIMKCYHREEKGVKWACQDCYKTKEQEYLQNYETILFHKPWEQDPKTSDYEKIKLYSANCYAGKKDQNGEILKQENCRHCQPWKFPNDNDNELDANSLLQYFQKNNIKSIKLTGSSGKLIIKYNDNSTITDVLSNFPKIKDLDKYLQNKSDGTISRQELELKINNFDTYSTTKPQNNEKTALWISCGIGGAIIISVIIGLLLKRRKRTKKV